MKILSKTDLFGALGYADQVTALTNDGEVALAFNIVSTGTVDITGGGDTDLIVSIGSGSSVSLTIMEGASHIVAPGGKLIIKKATAIGTYTLQAEIDWNDSVFLKQVTLNVNAVITREMSYRLAVTNMAILGVSSVADIASGATVKISDGSIKEIKTGRKNTVVIG